MDEQEDGKTYISEVKLNELMLRLGFNWTDENNWQHNGEVVDQLEAVEALRNYEDDK